MRKGLVIILAAWLVLGCSFQARAASFSGLDLVVLIDQSGSMWGSPAVKGRRNDPYDHRIGISQNILIRLAEHVRGRGVVHRMSVIDYGTKVRTSFSSLRLAHDPARPEEVMRTAAEKAISGIRPRYMSNTNTPGAMARAGQEFLRMNKTRPAKGRRRICLIITDGRPTLGSGVSLAAMRERVLSEAAKLKKLGAEIWVLGIDAADNYWNAGDGRFWKDLAGDKRARLAAHPSISLASIMQDIFSDWLGVSYQQVKGGSYQCPPYLGRLAFDVNFATRKSPTRIITPLGRAVAPSLGGDIAQPGTFMRFEIKNPVPGTYHLDPPSLAGRTVSVERHPLKVQRLSPLGPVSSTRRAKVSFKASTDRGLPLEPVPTWKIDARVIVSPLAGAAGKEELPAKFQGNGIFEAKWTPREKGKYSLILKGLVTMKGGRVVDVFKGSALTGSTGLEVKTPPPYKLLLLEPSLKGLTITPWQQEAAVKLALTDINGARVTASAPDLGDLNTLLKVQSLDLSGAPLSPALPMKHQGKGVFSAALPIKQRLAAGRGWLRPNNLAFRVMPGAGQDPRFARIHSLVLPGGKADQRVGGDPFSAGPVEMWLPLPVLLAMVLLPVVLTAGIAAYLFMVLLPNLRIRRQDRGRGLCLVVFDSINDPLAVNGIRLPLSGCRTKLDRRLKLNVGGDTHIATRLKVVRLHTAGKPEAIIHNAWDREKKERQDQIRLDQGRRISGLKGNHNYYFKLEAA